MSGAAKNLGHITEIEGDGAALLTASRSREIGSGGGPKLDCRLIQYRKSERCKRLADL